MTEIIEDDDSDDDLFEDSYVTKTYTLAEMVHIAAIESGLLLNRTLPEKWVLNYDIRTALKREFREFCDELDKIDQNLGLLQEKYLTEIYPKLGNEI